MAFWPLISMFEYCFISVHSDFDLVLRPQKNVFIIFFSFKNTNIFHCVIVHWHLWHLWIANKLFPKSFFIFNNLMNIS